MTTTANSVLSDDLLKRCMDRAAGYDRDNKFFDEDFQELKDAGYLLACVPKELGGLGLNLAQVGQEQRRLAYHSAATALAVSCAAGAITCISLSAGNPTCSAI